MTPARAFERRLAILAFASALAMPSCARLRGKGAAEFPGAPVVLISVDTLRSDHLPIYGYTKVATPAIDALRKGAILFERAYTHVPLTLPAHASILTGLLPEAHGVRDNQGYSLRKDVPTLAEMLKAAGYATGGAVSAIVLSGGSGMSRGFDLYDDALEPTEPNQTIGRVQRAGMETAAQLKRWIGGLPDGPFFAFLHIYEPHSPYDPPEPFKSTYASAYDGEIAAADAVVGNVVSFLKEKGIYDRAIVVFLSDHGEGLGEHGEDEHGVFLYREALQVPLLLKLPGSTRAGESVHAPAELVDVVPTLRKLLRIEGASTRQGPAPVTLLDLDDPKAAPRTVFAETFYPRLHLGWSELRSLISGSAHYIDAPRAELYDLAKDPAETHDLAPEKPQAFRTLRIETEKRRTAFAAPSAVDQEQAAKLASLGYISTGASAASGPLPDPKDRIETVRAIKKGVASLLARKYEEAAGTFKALVDENPRMLDIWYMYSEALSKLGRFDEALEALKRGVKESPESATHLLIPIANMALQLGRVDEARKNAEIARDRGDPTAEDVLARVYFTAKDLPKAEASALAALKTRSSFRAPYLTLARVEVARGNLSKALSYLDVLERKTLDLGLSPMATVHFLRGDILARMERGREAETEFQAEIARFPLGLEARSSLALLYASEGRIGDTRRVLSEMVGFNETPIAYEAAVRVATLIGDAQGAAVLRAQGHARFPHARL